MARNTRGKPKRDSAPAPQTPGDAVPFGRYPSPIPYFDEVLAAEWRLFERDGAGPVDPATLEPAVLRLRIVEHVRPVVERVLANPFVLRAVGYLRGPRPTLFPADVRRGWPSVLAAVLFLHSVDDAGRRAFAPDDPFARDGREAIEEALEREFARDPAKGAMNVGDALSFLSAVLDVNRNAVAAVDGAGEHVLEEALAVVARGAIPTPAGAGQGDGAQADADTGDAPKEPPRKPTLSKEALAIAALTDDPEASPADIARRAGCNVKSLYRMKDFQKARGFLREMGKAAMPRGRKPIEKPMEAWDEAEDREDDDET